MERRLITSPPNKQASSKWTQSDSDSQHISPVDEEASEHASKHCISHWPIYVTALILGIILFSVGLYFTVDGHLSNEKDDVILGSFLIFSGLCFGFVSIYRSFTILHSKTMDKDNASENASRVAVPSSITEDQEAANTTVCISSKGKPALVRGILKSQHFINRRNPTNKIVYFDTDQTHKESNKKKVILLKKVVMTDPMSGSADTNPHDKCQPKKNNTPVILGHFSGNSGRKMTQSAGAKLQAHHENNLMKSTGNTRVNRSVEGQSSVLKLADNIRHNLDNSYINGCSPNNTVSQNLAVSLNSPTSRDSPSSHDRLKPQLKVVIESQSDKERIHVSDVNVTSDPVDINVVRKEPSHRVQTLVDLCVHNTHLTNMCDSGQSSIDSVSIMDFDENKNIFMQNMICSIAPPREFSDDFQSSQFNTQSFECIQYTQTKRAFSEMSSQTVSPGGKSSKHKPVPGFLTFDDRIEVLSD